MKDRQQQCHHQMIKKSGPVKLLMWNSAFQSVMRDTTRGHQSTVGMTQNRKKAKQRNIPEYFSSHIAGHVFEVPQFFFFKVT